MENRTSNFRGFQIFSGAAACRRRCVFMFQSATSAANRHGSARAQASRKNNGVPVGAESICAAVWVTPYCYDRRETRAPARTNAIALRRNLLCLRPADSKGPRLQPLYRAAARAAAGVTRPTLG